MKKQPRPMEAVFIALLAAGIAGAFTGPKTDILGITLISFYDLVGRLFLNALTLVVIPLVAASMITGMARMGEEGQGTRLGKKAFSWFLATSSLAVFTACITAYFLNPGVGSPLTASLVENPLNIADGSIFAKVEMLLLKFIPNNVLAAASSGQILGLIPFCLAFGYCMNTIDPSLRNALLNFWKGLFQVSLKMTQLILKALPLGVFGLVAKVIATMGTEQIISAFWFAIAVIIALAIYGAVFLPLILRFIGGISPIRYLKALSPGLVTAFSTSSSSASLPIVLECVEQRGGISNRVASFALPLGTVLNLSGTALYQCLAVLFIAQAYGIPMTFATLSITGSMAFLFAIGMAGIPSAGLVVITLILPMLGLPAEGVGLILAVERILDMFRTVVSVWGNACCSALIARSEGELLPGLNSKRRSQEAYETT